LETTSQPDLVLVAGIDLAWRHCGVAVLAVPPQGKYSIYLVTTIVTTGGGHQSQACYLYDKLAAVLQGLELALVAYERPSWLVAKARQRKTSTASVVALARAEAILWVAAGRGGTKLLPIDPNQWRAEILDEQVPGWALDEADTEHLKASKRAVIGWALATYGVRLEHDQADALAIAHYCANRWRHSDFDGRLLG
jgi:Holliday junction resolvasome RuvABC endonuclease subunit